MPDWVEFTLKLRYAKAEQNHRECVKIRLLQGARLGIGMKNTNSQILMQIGIIRRKTLARIDTT